MSSSLLLQATKVGKGADALEIQNRVFMAPMTRGRATREHVPKPIMGKYYEQRSSAGVLISEGVGISQQGLGWFKAPGIWTDEQTEAWKPVVEAGKTKGAKMFAQLWHMGRQGHSDVMKETPVSSAEKPMSSPIPANDHERKDPETPHALTPEEIAAVVKDYGNAARNAKKAGFDGIELHGANGYLIDQFNQSVINDRTDEYGGSIENRLRFLREVLDEVLTVFPKERISVRLSPNGAFGEAGSEDNVETFTEAIKHLASKQIGIVHLMDGLGFGFHEKCEPFTAQMAREIIRDVQKDDIVTLLLCNVGYTKDTAEELIKTSLDEEAPVDVAVAFGRPYISTPDLVERFEKGKELNPDAPHAAWWGTDSEEGYTDFPLLSEA
ncbi:12-oxophytodienoate reductase 1 [Hondaea fermentalgiana]|uniref:12-oxophytodienoate reductase 1 n=1 Tax=Hondaea fermentalgiana TaxID=2315210 RepID=A0A2R5GHM6_9STRA|nr:12-oxophytodienoate reductase 1 [Hondaea fermentalgiana]|eukprot:GBG30390.1 12-oxophytodienoate reductase 1 [Hondaea fermentalgiana]